MYPITSLFFLEILFSGYSREEEREPCEQTPTSIPPSTNGAFLPRPQGLLLDDFKMTDSPARSCPPFRSGKRTAFAVMDAKWSKLYALFFFISLYETTSQV